jgi:hypothetical protein
MLLGPFNGLQNWQYAQISTPKKYAQISKKNFCFFKFFLGVFDTPEALFCTYKGSNLLPNGLNC